MPYCGHIACWQKLPCLQHGIKLIEKHVLHGAHVGGLPDPFDLGPFDCLVAPIIPIKIVYVFGADRCTRSKFIPALHIKEALMLLLDYYPHLMGRLQVNQCSREIVDTAKGAELYVAEAPYRLCDFGFADSLFDLPNGGNDLFPPYDLSRPCREHPILMVQHTVFACRSVALAIHVCHSITDAEGACQLITDLVTLYRRTRLGEPPYIKSFLADVPTDQAALQFTPTQYQLRRNMQQATSASASDEAAPSPSPTISGRVIRFSAANLAALKERATPADSWVSTFEALAAHLWQSVYRARAKLAGEAAAVNLHTDFLTPFNWRSPDRLNLPAHYFGNALSTPVIAPPHKVLLEAPLSQLAAMLHEVLRAQSKEEQLNALQWIKAQPDKDEVQNMFRYGNGGIMISDWSKLNLYAKTAFEADDFGVDIAPVLVTTPFTSISLLDGLGYLLPAPAAQGRAIDVHLALADPVWAALEADSEFCGQHCNILS